MKRLIALLTAFCLLGSPALASGLTALNGGGTGGAFASTSVSTAVASITSGATTVDIPVGSLGVIFVGWRAGAGVSITSCSDTAGNTWSSGAVSNSQSNATTRIYYTVSTIDMPIGTTFTCNLSSASSSIKAVEVMAFSGPAASPFDANANASGSSTGAITVGPVPSAGTLACNGTSDEVVVSVVSMLNGAAPTNLGSFTSLGYISDMFAAYQIVNSNVAVSFTPTLTGSSGNWSAQIQGFKASTCPASAANHTLLLMGVGQ